MPRLIDIFPEHDFEQEPSNHQQAGGRYSGSAQAAARKLAGLKKHPTLLTGVLGFSAFLLFVLSVVVIWYINTGRLDVMVLRLSNLGHSVSAQVGVKLVEIDIQGAERSRPQDIRDLLDIHSGQSLMALEPSILESHLEANLPWVKSARVERAFPQKLIIHIDEKVPAAIWKRDQEFVLIDRNGTTIDGAPVDKYANLILMDGDKVPEQATAFFNALDQEPDLKPLVQAAVLISGRRWDIRLGSNITAKLPDHDLAAAFSTLARTDEANDLLSKDVELIDLRLDDRLILRLREAEASRVLLNRKGSAA
jgi:cell division protein FtsQ